MNERDCKENINHIIQSIIDFYSKTQNWILESNIPIDDLYSMLVFSVLHYE